jgi:hypothetical protein
MFYLVNIIDKMTEREKKLVEMGIIDMKLTP